MHITLFFLLINAKLKIFERVEKNDKITRNDLKLTL